MKPLKPLDIKPCACNGGGLGPLPTREEMQTERRRVLEAKRQEREARVAEALAPPDSLAGKLGLTFAALVIWWYLYGMLPMFARVATADALKLDPASRLGSSVEFFLYDTPKVLMLLVLVVFGVGILRSFFTPARTRRLLAGRNEVLGSALSALLGTVTPFCSCSAVPLFIGFLTAGVPLGVTFAFLVSAPMVNEVALVLLYSMLGWKVAAVYMGAGLAVAMVSGLVVGRMKLDGQVEDWVRLARDEAVEEPELTWADRLDAGGRAVRDIVGKVWYWVIAGIAVGAGIHGYVPDAALAAVMGRGAWWSVPAAVIIGVPMYSNAAGIVPVLQALLEKGASLGTALAFMMSVIALSLPEAVILRRVLKIRLLLAFFGTVAGGIMLVGFLFNAFL
jgi:uncharacterized membrane protein YraQ (UPF0718 family)